MNLRSRILTVILALAGGTLVAQAQTPQITPRAVEIFEILPIQDGGRVKPVSTYADFTLLRLSGKKSLTRERGDDKLTVRSSEWLLGPDLPSRGRGRRPRVPGLGRRSPRRDRSRARRQAQARPLLLPRAAAGARQAVPEGQRVQPHPGQGARLGPDADREPGRGGGHLRHAQRPHGAGRRAARALRPQGLRVAHARGGAAARDGADVQGQARRAAEAACRGLRRPGDARPRTRPRSSCSWPR